MQEHALKIVKATEDFATGGHFAGPDAIKEAYSLLELAATYIHHIEHRETTLQSAIDFFNIAQSVGILCTLGFILKKTKDSAALKVGFNISGINKVRST